MTRQLLRPVMLSQVMLYSAVVSLWGCASTTREPITADAIVTKPASVTQAQPVPTAQPAQVQPTAAAQPQKDYYTEGLNWAKSAVSIGQTAQSQDDWKLAANRWQRAIKSLQQVPKGSANYSTAQTKLKEYQQNLTAAQKRAQGQTVASTQPAATNTDTNGRVARIPIKTRYGGTPVVPVSLKGQKGSQQFDMLFDTGATGTLITPAMANAIGVVIVDEVQVKIADGSVVTLPVGYIDRIEVGGLVKEGVLVAIGGDVALLGQDVYGEFGITMNPSTIDLYQ